MNYNETLQWMFGRLPMYQRQGKKAFKKNLNNILKLDKHLGFPSQEIEFIHIAGTNGKGSVSHMLASILQEAGYQIGLYTSPHLKCFRERIRINGQMIRKNCVINFIKRNHEFLEENQLSFFEMTFGLALEMFAKKKMDIAVIETGLGGRLDSTNIINPLLSIITNIGWDHTQMLGDSLEKIAFDKAGIIKKNTPIVIGKKQLETQKVFEEIALQKNAKLYYAETLQNFSNYPTDLKGIYQRENVATALKAIEVLQNMSFKIDEVHIKQGLMNVVKNTGLRGRWQILRHHPMVIADTAHNKDALQIVLQQLSKMNYKKLRIILSMVNDKDLDTILPLFPIDAIYYFSKADIPRGLNAQVLQKEAQKNGLTGKTYLTLTKAYEAALKDADKQDLIFVGGSTFTVAEIL